jgi:hypothetical protein
MKKVCQYKATTTLLSLLVIVTMQEKPTYVSDVSHISLLSNTDAKVQNQLSQKKSSNGVRKMQ